VTRIEPGTLKCVIATMGTDALLAALPKRVRPDDIRRIGPAALVVYTALEPAELRDWLSGYLEGGESLLVIEFEKWSGFGDRVDRVWLLERGH
jgi:hypothetical protein